MFSGRTTTTVSAPASGPMDLNEAGRPQWRELLPLFGVALLGVVVAALGGILFIVSLPRPYGEWSGWNSLGVIVGGTLIYGGASWFWSLRSVLTSGVTRYYARVDDWHYAMLEQFTAGDGRVVAQQVSEWEYNPLDLRSMLLAYAALLVSQPSRLTVDQLQQHGLWVRVEHRDMKVMTFTQDSAAAFLNLLAQAKIITGRGPRQAGQLLVAHPQQQLGSLLRILAKDPSVMATMHTLEAE
jgi:hypothetical protein